MRLCVCACERVCERANGKTNADDYRYDDQLKLTKLSRARRGRRRALPGLVLGRHSELVVRLLEKVFHRERVARHLLRRVDQVPPVRSDHTHLDAVVGDRGTPVVLGRLPVQGRSALADVDNLWTTGGTRLVCKGKYTLLSLLLLFLCGICY